MKYEALLDPDALIQKMDSAGVNGESTRKELSDFYFSMQKRKESLDASIGRNTLPPQPDNNSLNKLQKITIDYEKSEIKYNEDAKKQDRSSLIKQRNEVDARKWLSQHKKSIEEEVERLRQIELLKKAKKKTNSKPLSNKKSELAEALITENYIKRFEDELKIFRANSIRIELVKTRTDKGRVLHQLKLKDAFRTDAETGKILSEGEYRIISIAAFPADMEGSGSVAPFIFDDPISSLDQDFEEATVSRLINLSSTRQVIVFTHRLSLLSLLQEAAKKMNIEPNIVCLTCEPWGTGEPGSTPINVKKPISALNSMKNDRLSKARNILRNEGQAEYEILAKSICSDIRIVIERMIENDLLADTVQRFRRAVQTNNKIHKLAKITIEDCNFFDDFMTKYSRYEHSQPYELPISLPPPDEIENDLNELINWRERYKKR